MDVPSARRPSDAVPPPGPAAPVGPRSTSVALRRSVDAAVGPHFDLPFARLDLLLVSGEARCGCPECLAVVAGRRAGIVAAIPSV